MVCDSSGGQTRCRTKEVAPAPAEGKAEGKKVNVMAKKGDRTPSRRVPSKRSASSSSSSSSLSSSTTTASPPTPTPTPKIRWRNSGLTGLSSGDGFSPGRSYFPPSPPPPGPRSTLPPEVARAREAERFYRNYDPKEGVVTAVVLGGFFAFVCLLVVYKTKCKPMWKNRRKRLHNTPATHSMVDNEQPRAAAAAANAAASSSADFGTDLAGEGGGAEAVEAGPLECCDGDYDDDYDQDYDDDDYLDDYEYECIPLRSVFAGGDGEGGGFIGSEVSPGGGEGGGGRGGEDEEEEEGDIYFLDEFGNYVFPETPPGASAPGSCSCHPSSVEDVDGAGSMLTAFKRRQSQVGFRGGYLLLFGRFFCFFF